MRVIATHTIRRYWKNYPQTEQALKAWLREVEQSDWDSPQAQKKKFGNASILSGKRVVFNINGNKYRLIVDIEYRLKIVFVVWFGSHSEYDLIDSKAVNYVKTNKNR
ncbi:MAG: type II toxin-antitoxin system HigB family toxin [Saprospiraceae bacterium]|nr:type II toxin-antitoxin system HigB family toxin [Saprospiraceae bacterium]